MKDFICDDDEEEIIDSGNDDSDDDSDIQVNYLVFDSCQCDTL